MATAEQKRTLMLELFGRLRARVLHVLGLVSKRDLLALETRLDTLSREFRRQTRLLKRAQRGLAAATGEIVQIHGLVGTGGRLNHVERNLHALIRGQFVDRTTLPFPQRILAQRFHIRSQYEEDGITLALINVTGTTNRRFLELGSGLNGGNTGFLAETCGWTGLMVDGNADLATRLRRRFARYGVDAKELWITRDNVNQLARDHRLDGEIDLLSLDLDGNDYWVWRALDACSPRMVLLRFNAAFGADRAVTVPYISPVKNDRATMVHYHGASLAAVEHLGQEKGYRLVMVEPRGVYAYLLRNDVAPEIPAATARALHPHADADTQPLFNRLAKKRLPLVDVASEDGQR